MELKCNNDPNNADAIGPSYVHDMEECVVKELADLVGVGQHGCKGIYSLTWHVAWVGTVG
jgi:hypothetical protein